MVEYITIGQSKCWNKNVGSLLFTSIHTFIRSFVRSLCLCLSIVHSYYRRIQLPSSSALVSSVVLFSVVIVSFILSFKFNWNYNYTLHVSQSFKIDVCAIINTLFGSLQLYKPRKRRNYGYFSLLWILSNKKTVKFEFSM